MTVSNSYLAISKFFAIILATLWHQQPIFNKFPLNGEPVSPMIIIITLN